MDDEDEIKILKGIFDRFDTPHKGVKSGFLDCNKFVSFITTLSGYVPTLKNVDNYVVKSVYKYLDKSGDGRLSFEEIKDWWLSPNKYTLFAGEYSESLTKANKLYSKYAVTSSQLSYDEFERLLNSIGISHRESTFDEIDKDGDGLLSFGEFVDWLGWLELKTQK